MKSLIVEGVSKRYWVPRRRSSADRKSGSTASGNVFSVPLAREILGAQEVWALKDVTFDVDHGTVLGIIGCNGAGKSDAAQGDRQGHRADRAAASAGGDAWSRCSSSAPASTMKRRRARTSS